MGKGTADDVLFGEGARAHFQLADSSILKSGMVVLTYTLA